MSGRICVQGGDEFTPPCQTMDLAWQSQVPRGRVTIMPLACTAGAEYRLAGSNGQRYLTMLGFDDVSVGPEPGLSLDGAVRSIVQATTVVLPGGSPSRIRERVVGTAIGAALRAHLAGGGTLVGASAGAMVLGGWMLLPGVDDGVHPGLGLLPDVLVLPHFDGADDRMVRSVRRRVDDAVTILALPACNGVLYRDDGPVSLGHDDCWTYAVDGSPVAVPRP